MVHHLYKKIASKNIGLLSSLSRISLYDHCTRRLASFVKADCNVYRIIKLVAIRHTFFSLQKDEVFASNTVNELVCPETFFVCPQKVFLGIRLF